jgi:BASS family bile acid:Na+ symporter
VLLKTVAPVLLGALVPLLALAVGLGASVRDVWQGAKNPLLWRALAAALVGVPVLAFTAALVLPLDRLGKGLLVLMAISPGAPFFLNKVRLNAHEGSVALDLAVALSFASVPLVPIGLAVVNDLFPLYLHAAPEDLLKTLAPTMWGPLAIGMGLRSIWPRAATWLERVARTLFTVDLVVVALLVLVVAAPHAGRLAPLNWVAMVGVTLGAAVLGDLAAGRACQDRTTIAYAVVLGNPAVALLVARTSYPEFDLAPFFVIYVLVRAVVMKAYEVSMRRLRHDAGHVAPT